MKTQMVSTKDLSLELRQVVLMSLFALYQFAGYFFKMIPLMQIILIVALGVILYFIVPYILTLIILCAKLSLVTLPFFAALQKF